MTRGFLCVMLLAVLAFGFSDTGVRAEPLDAATCGQLKGEQVRMEQGGVRGNMEKGPAWAKTNLAADKLDQIRRLIELDEQLLFRCSSRNLVELPPDADADPTPPSGKADEEGKDTPPKAGGPPAPQNKPAAAAKAAPAAPAKKPAAQPKPKAAAKTEPATAKAPAKDAGSAAPPANKPAAAKPEPKPKPKPKADDAYKAPPTNPNVDPFANQPVRQ